MSARGGIAAFLHGLASWFQPRHERGVRGTYDAAQTTSQNSKHWANTDALSANAAASPTVRKTLRERARYETANSVVAQGMISTLAVDTVGAAGPRLQLVGDPEAAEHERQWSDWARQIKLASKLRTVVRARTQDGEAFGLKVDNPRVNHLVKLDLRLIECDQVVSPWASAWEVDGIVLDEWKNVVSYSVLKQHPGNIGIGTFSGVSPGYGFVIGDFETVRAEHMIHWFRADRPGQYRGIPLIAPSLMIMPGMRRWAAAVLASAEMAASFSGVLHTDGNALPESTDDESKIYDQIYLAKNALLTLPRGWDMRQIDPMQPAATHSDYMRENMMQVGRPLNMPYSVSAADNSRNSYSSARMDQQCYHRSIDVDRADIETDVLDPLFADWRRWYWLETGRQIQGIHEWMWPGWEHVDPVKEASATEIELRNGMTTRKEEWARKGQDWETAMEQQFKERALEVKLEKRFGVTLVKPAEAPTGRPQKEPEGDSREEAVN